MGGVRGEMGQRSVFPPWHLAFPCLSVMLAASDDPWLHPLTHQGLQNDGLLTPDLSSFFSGMLVCRETSFH